jgi:hypothetical protein
MGNISGVGTACPSEAPELIPVFYGVDIARSFIFCVVFCGPLFVILSTVWSVFRSAVCIYSFEFKCWCLTPLTAIFQL